MKYSEMPDIMLIKELVRLAIIEYEQLSTLADGGANHERADEATNNAYDAEVALLERLRNLRTFGRQA